MRHEIMILVLCSSAQIKKEEYTQSVILSAIEIEQFHRVITFPLNTHSKSSQHFQQHTVPQCNNPATGVEKGEYSLLENHVEI
jgi:hypothetical protein